MARRFETSDDELRALETGNLNGFAAEARAALQFAEQLTHDSNHISDAVFTELRNYFSEGEIVEITAVASLFNYFNRFNNALQVEPTR